jgi:hypothetical protein
VLGHQIDAVLPTSQRSKANSIPRERGVRKRDVPPSRNGTMAWNRNL